MAWIKYFLNRRNIQSKTNNQRSYIEYILSNASKILYIFSYHVIFFDTMTILMDNSNL